MSRLLVDNSSIGCEPSQGAVYRNTVIENANVAMYAIIQVADIPLTATGKIDKKPLRAEFQDYLIR